MSPTHRGIGPALGRVVGIVAGLLVVGLVLKLIGLMLQPVLPAAMYQVLAAGWNLLYALAGPALNPIAAVAILAAIIWVVVGRRR